MLSSNVWSQVNLHRNRELVDRRTVKTRPQDPTLCHSINECLHNYKNNCVKGHMKNNYMIWLFNTLEQQAHVISQITVFCPPQWTIQRTFQPHASCTS